MQVVPPCVEPPMSATVASAPARKQMISERQKRSAVWRLIHMFGSLQLALILLATIAIACAIATFAESNFNTKIAQTYIYKAPWFTLWLASSLRQSLCGHPDALAMAKKAHRVCGHSLRNNHPPCRSDDRNANRLRRQRNTSQGRSARKSHHDKPKHHSTGKSGGSALYLMRFDAEATPPSARRPRTFPVPQTDLKVVADDFSPNLVRDRRFVASDAPDAGPAVLLKLSSNMAGQTVDVLLSLSQGQEAESRFFWFGAHFSSSCVGATSLPRRP